MSLHVDALGQGPGTVVLLHGLPTPPEAMRALGERLSGTSRVLIPHLPGYGRSPASDPAPAAKAERVAAAVEAFTAEPVDVVGFSGGFHLGCLLALEGRLPIRRLIGLGPSVGVEPEDAPVFRGFADLARQGVDLSEAFGARMLSEAFRAEHPARAQEVARWIFAAPARHLADELEAYAAAGSLRDRLGGVGAPVRLFVGEHDAATPPAHSHAIAARLPDASVSVLLGSGHACFVERLDAVALLVREALER